MKDAKATAREAAFARRSAADPEKAPTACRHLIEAVRNVPGTIVSGYWPIRTELDPRVALHELSETHAICLPVVVALRQPLTFRRWRPGAAMSKGVYGAMIPATSDEIVPDILIVPLAAFDNEGYRLGYGGGFYDRTLERLRARGPVTAIGFAYSLQKCARVPREPTDQPLDLIVTEAGASVPVEG